jgi:hypothetical protein
VNQSRFWEGVAPRSYEEKRKYHRMTLDCALSYVAKGETQPTAGQCKNLSTSGILFVVERAIAVGSRLQINITPERTVVPPLNAAVEVVRVEPGATPEQFRIAARILKIN